MIEWVQETQAVGAVAWIEDVGLGAVKDPKACSDLKAAMTSATNAQAQIAKDLADANTQVIQAKESGDQNAIAAAESYLKAAQAGYAANQNQIVAIANQMKTACAEVSAPPPGPCANCKADEECVNDKCVKKCPANYVRAADGTCKLPEPSTGGVGGTNWGLVLLAAGAAVAAFFALRGLGKDLPAQENREAA